VLCLQDQKCIRGDDCPHAHNVFEYWLHPTRYRTQLCNDGTACNRKICFFAHTPEELRSDAEKPLHVTADVMAAATLAAVRKSAARKAQLQQSEVRAHLALPNIFPTPSNACPLLSLAQMRALGCASDGPKHSQALG
jgi:hypothetical protein